MKKYILSIMMLAGALATQAQEAPTTGFLLPRMTTAQKTALVNPAKGLTIYNTDSNVQEINTGTSAAPVWSVVGTSTNSDWTYNGTDAIQATRALASNDIISVRDNGNVFINQGNPFDWTTYTRNGINPKYSSNPANAYPHLVYRTTDNLAYVNPEYNTTSNAQYSLENINYIMRNDHVQNSNQTTKRYTGNISAFDTEGLTFANISEINGMKSYTSVDTGTSSNFGNVWGGLYSTFYGGTGNITSQLLGLSMSATSNSTGSVSTITSSLSSSTNMGTGTVTSMRASNFSSTINASASIPLNTYASTSSVTNNSTLSGLGTENFYGNVMSLTNNGPVKFTSIRGFQQTINNQSGAGSFTNGYGIQTSLNNNSNSTDLIGNMWGISNTLTHNSKASVSNIYGEQTGLTLGANSAGTLSSVFGIRISFSKNAASTTTITNNYGLYLEPIAGGVTNNYAIYSAGGNSYLKDKLLINTTTATDAMLNVNGAIQIGTYTGGTPVAGMIRFNTTTSKFEGYNGTAWVEFH